MQDLMETETPKAYGMNKAQSDGITQLIIALIMLIGVSIPITQQVITSANLTGLSSTIVGFVPVFLAMASLVLVAGIMSGRKK